MAILDQLFGIQPQQDQGGLVQSILSQRFQPSPDDINMATAQSGMQRNYVSPGTVMQQRISPGMAVAGQLSNIGLQGQQEQELQLKNQMTQNMMPYMMGQMQDLYGQQPPVGFPQGQPNQPQQDGNQPPVGFNNPTQPDPRIKKAEIAAMMGNKTLSEALMQEYNADPNVISQKAKSEATGKDSAANALMASKSDELTKRLEMNLNAMLELNPNVPSGGFIPAEGHTYLSQATGANPWMGNMGIGDKGAGAQAANQWDQINNQQIISEIQQFIASGGANTRTNQTLERIVKAASGIDKNGLPQSREAQIRNALAEIQNKNVSAENIAGGNKSYQPIPVQGSADQPPQGWSPEMWSALTPEEKATLK